MKPHEVGGVAAFHSETGFGDAEARRCEVDRLIAEWTRIGAGFNVEPAAETPDIERLLLDTARLASADSRLFAMAMTWLSMYDRLVARHRLARLVLAELEPGYRPVLGLLLELAQAQRGGGHLNSVIALCAPADLPGPLFEVDRGSPALAARAEQRASEASKRWNLWTEDMPVKRDAIRPAGWIIDHNPIFRARADFKGDLRASILEVLRGDAAAGASESELARHCGVTRMAVRAALADLELGGWVMRETGRRRTRTVIRERADATSN
ncbi:MAG: GntR family transcriptional regulator [Phycisphaerales bacterium]|nr:GntR family transcriptional regulator [Phycisphaerales bacterium]